MKTSLLITLIVLGCLEVTYSQGLFLSPKHQDKLNKISNPYKRALKYRKYHLKDSLKQTKQLLKQGVKTAGNQAFQDSLSAIPEVGEYQVISKTITQMDSAKVANMIGEVGKNSASE